MDRLVTRCNQKPERCDSQQFRIWFIKAFWAGLRRTESRCHYLWAAAGTEGSSAPVSEGSVSAPGWHTADSSERERRRWMMMIIHTATKPQRHTHRNSQSSCSRSPGNVSAMSQTVMLWESLIGDELDRERGKHSNLAEIKVYFAQEKLHKISG